MRDGLLLRREGWEVVVIVKAANSKAFTRSYK